MPWSRFLLGGLVACAATVGAATPATAQQTLNFTLGYFVVQGEDARVAGDVITQNLDVLALDVRDFNSGAVGVEWLVPIGEYLEGGAGVAFSRRTVPTVYRRFVDSDGSEIEQDLRLRLVPVSFTVRVLPFGQSSGVQPYVGAGLSLVSWRYAEFGEFVDPRDRAIFRDQFTASGSASAPVALGGIRFAADTVSAGGEVRYHRGDVALPREFASGPLEPRLDLGGWSYLFTVGIRFGG